MTGKKGGEYSATSFTGAFTGNGIGITNINGASLFKQDPQFLILLKKAVAYTALACYLIGRVVVPVVSVGRWKCDRMAANTSRRKLRAAGWYRLRGRQVYLTPEATQFVGFVALLLVIGAGVLVWYLTRR